MDTNKKAINVKLNSTPDKIIPKLCSNINFVVTNKRQIIASLIFMEPSIEPKSPPSQATLIERIMIDVDHASSLVDVLGKMIKEIKKNENNINQK